MLIAVNGPAAAWATPLTAPSIDRWDEQPPALRYVNLSVVRISEGATRCAPLAARRSLRSPAASPLIVATERPGLRTLSFGWNFLDSDLPLRVGFPILLGNAIRWLSQSGGGADSAPHPPRRHGQPDRSARRAQSAEVDAARRRAGAPSPSSAARPPSPRPITSACIGMTVGRPASGAGRPTCAARRSPT